MREDPIVEEMRSYGQAFAAKHGNHIGRICAALRNKDAASARKMISRPAKLLEQKAAS